MTLLALYFQFFKFGSLAFGGGYTIFPLLFDTFVTKTQMFTADAFGNLISIAQMTPGPVTINVATFVGFLKGGVWASLVASLGLISPSLIFTGLALFLMKKYRNSWFVQGFLKGAHLVALIMILYTIILFTNMSIFPEPWPLADIFKTITSGYFVGPKGYHVNWLELAVAVVAFTLVQKKIPVTRLLLGAALFGLGISFL